MFVYFLSKTTFNTVSISYDISDSLYFTYVE
jgi:hypothetical protein